MTEYDSPPFPSESLAKRLEELPGLLRFNEEMRFLLEQDQASYTQQIIDELVRQYSEHYHVAVLPAALWPLLHRIAAKTMLELYSERRRALLDRLA